MLYMYASINIIFEGNDSVLHTSFYMFHMLSSPQTYYVLKPISTHKTAFFLSLSLSLSF